MSSECGVIEITSTDTVVSTEKVTEVVEVLEPVTDVVQSCEQGPPGPPGQSGASYLTYMADGGIGGHRAVRATTPGKVGYVDPDDPAQAHAVIGLTMGAASDGSPVNVQFGGEMTEPSWAWIANLPIFVGATGVPTQTAPALGFHAPIGVAISPTAMVIQIKTPVVL